MGAVFTRKCPFCRKSQLAVHPRHDPLLLYEGDRYSVHCLSSGCHMIGPEGSSIEEAVERFNMMGIQGEST